MATDNDNELPQTQSQSNNLDETFSQLDDNTPNAWGRLVNKLKKMRTVGMFHRVNDFNHIFISLITTNYWT